MLETKYLDDKIEILVTIRDQKSVTNLKSPTSLLSTDATIAKNQKVTIGRVFLFHYES